MELTKKELEALKIFAETADRISTDFCHRTKHFTKDLVAHGYSEAQAGGIITALEKKVITLEDDLYSRTEGDLMWCSMELIKELLG